MNKKHNLFIITLIALQKCLKLLNLILSNKCKVLKHFKIIFKSSVFFKLIMFFDYS